MPEYAITVDPQSLDKVYAALKGRMEEFRRVGQRAVERTAVSLRTALVRELAGSTGMSQKTLRKAYVWLKRRELPPLNMQVKVRGAGVKIAHLRPRQTKAGVVYKGMGGGLLAHAFGPRTRLRGRAVVRRRGPARLPVETLRTGSLVPLVKNRLPRLLADAAGKLKRELLRGAR